MRNWRDKVKARRSRTKGHAFERDTAISLRHIFPDVKRHLEFQFQEAHGIDLDNTGRYRVQCKRHRAYVPVSTISEIQFEPLVGEVPVLVTGCDDGPTMAVLPWSDLIDLIETNERKTTI